MKRFFKYSMLATALATVSGALLFAQVGLTPKTQLDPQKTLEPKQAVPPVVNVDPAPMTQPVPMTQPAPVQPAPQPMTQPAPMQPQPMVPNLTQSIFQGTGNKVIVNSMGNGKTYYHTQSQGQGNQVSVSHLGGQAIDLGQLSYKGKDNKSGPKRK
jgi:hypothetical protein